MSGGIRPQVSMLIDRDALDKLSPMHKEFIKETMGSFVFVDFCKLQVQKVEDDLSGLNLNWDFGNEDTAKLCEDMRLVRRFWTDLLRFAEDLKQQQ